MAYAEVSEVADRLGRELPPELEIMVATRLDDAERLLKHRIKDLDDQIASGDIDVEDVKYVEAEAVLRLARNPDGYVQEADGDYSYQLSEQLASGVLEIKPKEWKLLGVVTKGFVMLRPSMEMPT